MKRSVALLVIPLAGLGVILSAFLLRGRDEPVAPRRAPQAPAVRIAAVSPTLPPPVPSDVAARAAEEARVKSTYQNFRAAVATGNGALEKALAKALARDHAAAVQYAREDLARASEPLDREIARKTLAALERSR